ncbi:hypothetical protein J19TS2_07920 [Cohnella xylanilytica]|nr:hypothetical protein J19TS2_07920 [Cohnella xylanilytica]
MSLSPPFVVRPLGPLSPLFNLTAQGASPPLLHPCRLGHAFVLFIAAAQGTYSLIFIPAAEIPSLADGGSMPIRRSMSSSLSYG